MPDRNQWNTIAPLLSRKPSWIGEPDATRVASYDAYEDIFWNVPDTFKLLTRGSENAKPIYIPSGRSVVETLHRYMANDLQIVADPLYGTPQEQLDSTLILQELLRRERFYSKFAGNKRYGIIRGDWMWHLYANPERLEGSRVSIFTLHPGNCVPITQPDNIEEVIGWHLVFPTLHEGKDAIRRLTYRKESGMGGPSPITREEGVFEVDGWDDRAGGELKQLASLLSLETLPDPIDSLPVYHIQNFWEPNATWGSSEMRGLEVIMGGINQAISDEELSLALEGLGVYATNAGTPVDNDTGEETGWNLGPARVLELPEGDNVKFERVTGITSVTPYMDHLKYLHDRGVDEGSGTPKSAKGVVDVQVAESGVALTIEMGPMLARSAEKEQIVTDVHVNMFFDLRKWIQAYDNGLGNVENVRWVPKYGDKIPVNKEKKFEEIMSMIKEKVISAMEGRRQLMALGFQFTVNDQTMMEEILTETEAVTKVAGDAFGSRMADELSAAELEAPAAETEPEPVA